MSVNRLEVEALSAFIQYCEDNNLKPSDGKVLTNYVKRRKFNVGYQLNVNKIKGLMTENKITQKDLAAMIDLSATQTHKKLTGQVDFKVSELLAIADLLCVEPNVFFTPKVSENETINSNV